MTHRKSSGLLPLIVVCMALGAGARLYGLQTADVNARPVVAPQDGAIHRLKAVVEAAEKAAKAEDWVLVADSIEEAEVMMGSWPLEALDRLEIEALLERLKDVEATLDEAVPSEPEEGLKLAEESVVLVGEDLRAQLEQIKVAEQDAAFDFPIDLNDKVLSWVYDFTHGKRGFVEGALSRATQYLPMIRQIFQEERVPQDLVYLALIESGFKNTARSRAKAVGMWQFIRSTGRMYGLDGNAWIEERRDPVKSCRASARYLRHLYEASGDWYLALAGYNAGPMTLERAGNALGSRNFWDMARSAYLRDETKQYVPKLLAAILVGRFPERYGLEVVQMAPYVYETVEVDKMTSLSVLANYAGTDVEELKELNPELLRATTPPGRYTLRVPPGTSGLANRGLARIPSGKRLDFQNYVVRKTDTLAKVAARFRVSPEDLLQANNLTKAQFRAGRRIQVPPPSTVPIDTRDLKPVAAKDPSLIERPLANLPVIPPDQAVDSEPAGQPLPQEPSARPARAVEVPAKPGTHVVKKGETLFSVSERYGIAVGDLRKWNRIKRNRIVVGQTLKLRRP